MNRTEATMSTSVSAPIAVVGPSTSAPTSAPISNLIPTGCNPDVGHSFPDQGALSVSTIKARVQRFLTFLRSDSPCAFSRIFPRYLRHWLEAHLRNHFTSIESAHVWEEILGWRPLHTPESARAMGNSVPRFSFPDASLFGPSQTNYSRLARSRGLSPPWWLDHSGVDSTWTAIGVEIDWDGRPVHLDYAQEPAAGSNGHTPEAGRVPPLYMSTTHGDLIQHQIAPSHTQSTPGVSMRGTHAPGISGRLVDVGLLDTAQALHPASAADNACSISDPNLNPGLVKTLKTRVRSYLSSLYQDSPSTFACSFPNLRPWLEAHLRGHFTSIQSDDLWEEILGWRPLCSTESAHAIGLQVPRFQLPPASWFTGSARGTRRARRISWTWAAAGVPIQMGGNDFPGQWSAERGLLASTQIAPPSLPAPARSTITFRPRSPTPVPISEENNHVFHIVDSDAAAAWEAIMSGKGGRSPSSLTARYSPPALSLQAQIPPLPTLRSTNPPRPHRHGSPVTTHNSLIAGRDAVAAAESMVVGQAECSTLSLAPPALGAQITAPPIPKLRPRGPPPSTHKVAEEASLLLEVFSRSPGRRNPDNVKNRELIKGARYNVKKIWDTYLRREGKGPASPLHDRVPLHWYDDDDEERPRDRVPLHWYDEDDEDERDLMVYLGCAVCYSAVAETVLLPCHHLALCLVRLLYSAEETDVLWFCHCTGLIT